MNVVTRLGISTLFLIGTCLLIAGATTEHKAPLRTLRVAIVDGCPNLEARDATHVAFALSLRDALTEASGTAIAVKIQCVNADHAAFEFGAKTYDAVLVIAPTLPRSLKLSNVTRLSARIGDEKLEKRAYLIFGPVDPTLGDQISAAFGLALADERFLAAYEGESDPGAQSGGAKVAAAH